MREVIWRELEECCLTESKIQGRGMAVFSNPLFLGLFKSSVLVAPIIPPPKSREPVYNFGVFLEAGRLSRGFALRVVLAQVLAQPGGL